MSSQVKKNAWEKLISPFTRQSNLRKEGSLNNKLSVNEEYKETLRTKSYVEMWSKVHGQLSTNTTNTKLSSSPSIPDLYVHLSEYLLEPRQETLMNMIQTLHFHHLLIDYFESSLEICNLCESLLQSIHQTRSNYRRIKRVIKLTKSTCPDEQQCHAIFSELAAFALLKNPLSIVRQAQFRNVHDRNMVLLRKLTSKCKKIKRRAKFNRFFKRVGGFSLIFTHTALLVALLILAVHSMAGIAAAPGLLAFSLISIIKKMKKMAQKGLKTSLLERLGAQLDVAAKGVYILINDFDTMSRLVRRLQDEVEHGRAVADLCVKNGRSEVLKEVVREFHIQESGFLDLLEELEEHIYLCFLTINRSRRLVLQEIMYVAPQQ